MRSACGAPTIRAPRTRWSRGSAWWRSAVRPADNASRTSPLSCVTDRLRVPASWGRGASTDPGPHLIVAVALGGCALDAAAAPRPIGRGIGSRAAIPARASSPSTRGGSALGTATLAALGADAGEAALLPAVLGAAFILSAVSGNGKVNDCRAARAEYEAAERSRQMLEDDDGAIARRAVLPRPVVPPPAVAPGTAGRPPAPVSAPAAAPPAAAPPAAASPDAVPPDAAPQAAAPARPPPKPAPAPAPPPPPPLSERWIEFWKELP